MHTQTLNTRTQHILPLPGLLIKNNNFEVSLERTDLLVLQLERDVEWQLKATQQIICLTSLSTA